MVQAGRPDRFGPKTSDLNRYLTHWDIEAVFGGITEHMLFKTDLPVLMLHR